MSVELTGWVEPLCRCVGGVLQSGEVWSVQSAAEAVVSWVWSMMKGVWSVLNWAWFPPVDDMNLVSVETVGAQGLNTDVDRTGQIQILQNTLKERTDTHCHLQPVN